MSECTEESPCSKCEQVNKDGKWGEHQSLDPRACRFTRGTTRCINEPCDNPYHKEYEDPYVASNPFKVKYDRYGRYLGINPLTGKEEPFTRATTITKTLEDTYHLNQWEIRHVLWGAANNDDLIALILSAEGPDDKKVLSDVIKQAKTRAMAERKSNLGTTLHGFSQKVDLGQTFKIPEQHRDWITRYKTVCHAFGFEWITRERSVILPELLIAGTADGIANWHRSVLPIVSDLKTGSIEYAKVAIAQQLAIYANCTHYWDDDGIPQPLMEMNRDEAIVIHHPAEGDDEPKVYLVDIAEGWKLVQESLTVRGIRQDRGKHLFTEIKADAMNMIRPSAAAVTEEALRTRLKKIKEHSAAYAALKGMWEGPTLREGGLTTEQLVRALDWCEQVEKEHAL